MKNLVITLLSFVLLCACEDMLENKKPDEGQDKEPIEETTFNVEDLYGLWEVTDVRYESELSNNDLSEESEEGTPLILFDYDGTYAAGDIWGKFEEYGTYEISGNNITASFDGLPFVEYEVLSLDQNRAELMSFIIGLDQRMWISLQECEDEVVEIPDPVIPNEMVLENEKEACALVLDLYHYFRRYMICQHIIEYKALTNNRYGLHESSSLLHTTWTNASSSIRLCNTILDCFAASQRFSWTQSLETHVRALRAFIYYQLIVLWGDVPYLTEDNYTGAISKSLPRTSASEILTSEIASIGTLTDSMDDVDLGAGCMTQDAVYALIAEMNLYMSKSEVAEAYLDKIDVSSGIIYNIPVDNMNFDIPEFYEYKKLIWGDKFDFISIYSSSTIDLYYKEIAGETSVVLAEWSTQPQYGYWATLSRLGMAQEVTGCEEYEVLMPIPLTEMETNPNLIQNPGYFGY